MKNYSENDMVFDDIRPYRDSEVENVIQKFLKSGDLEKRFSALLGKYLTFYNAGEKKGMFDIFKNKLNQIRSVADFQKEIVLKFMLEPMIKGTIDSLTESGFENLSKDESYLFIGNHRDITLDPTILNYLLFSKGFKTVEVAIGDNLLKNSFISDMIRLNKSFIVKRNLPLIQRLQASVHLSKYIFHTINQKSSVWIAQREGRAKDGNDFTNPALISMLHLSQREGGLSLTDYIKKVKIVPVAVSYEYDPCDRLKALEIFNSRGSVKPEKNLTDDLVSINQGITGYKGRVHYSVSEPVAMDDVNHKLLVGAIDRAIQLSYHLWPTNYLAFDELNETRNYSSFYDCEKLEIFKERLKRFTPEIKSIILEGYANPVKNYEAQYRMSAPVIA